MNSHDHPPMIETDGLQDACPRCKEIAVEPLRLMDDTNIAILVARTRSWMAGELYARSHVELTAMRVVERALLNARVLQRVEGRGVREDYGRD